MLTYVDWTPGRRGRVQTELLQPLGLPVLYTAARDVPTRRLLRMLRAAAAGTEPCAVPSCREPSRRRQPRCGITERRRRRCAVRCSRRSCAPCWRKIRGGFRPCCSRLRLLYPQCTPLRRSWRVLRAGSCSTSGRGRRLSATICAAASGFARAAARHARRSASVRAAAALPRSFSVPTARVRQRVEYGLSASCMRQLVPLRRTDACSAALFQSGRLPLTEITVKSMQLNA